MLFKSVAVASFLVIAACAQHPQTDEDLAGEAQHAVDSRLDAQATFTDMESVAARQIACGHASATDVPRVGGVDQDFVYVHGRLIMDNEPDYDQAAVACDVATGGENTTELENAVKVEPRSG